MYIISIIVIVFDQLVKFLIRSNLSYHQSIPIINKVLHISYVRNTGMAFGMFPGINVVFQIIATLVVLFIIIFERRGKIKTPAERVFFGLILGGATGNLIDRYVLGFITDFIDFRIFPVFNVADSCIFVGAALLFILYFRKKPEAVEEEKEETAKEETGRESSEITEGASGNSS